jgi:hypothetical protein
MHEKLEKLGWRPKRRQLIDLKQRFSYSARRELSKLVKLSLLWSPKLFSSYLTLP